MNLRPAIYNDAAGIAYGIMVWDSELPKKLQMIKGNASDAFRAAEMMCGACFVTWVVEDKDRVVGGIAIKHSINLFGFQPYGRVTALFVLPSYRGKLLGLRLLRRAIATKEKMDWQWLEMNPLATDAKFDRVLRRFGFDEVDHTFMLR